MNNCNICSSANINVLHISNAIDIKMFKDSVKFFITDILFPNSITLYLCFNCYDTLSAFNRFRHLCLENEISLKNLYKISKTESDCEKSKPSALVIDVEPQSKIKIDLTNDETNNEGPSAVIPSVKLRLGSDNKTNSTNIKITKKKKPYKCDFCSKSFENPNDLLSHNSSEHKSYKCNKCEMKFTKNDHLLMHKHQKHNTNKPVHFKCEICNKFFVQRNGLANHNDSKHKSKEQQNETQSISDPVETKPKYQCCNKVFLKLKYMVQHQSAKHKSRTSNGTGKCLSGNEVNFQDNSKNTNSQLTNEIKLDKAKVTKENKSYKCEYCTKDYKKRVELLSHKGEEHKCFECDICAIKYATKDLLLQHGNEKHNNKNPTAHQCPFCVNVFLKVSNLSLHLKRVHARFECNICHTIFSKENGFLTHMFKMHNVMDSEAYKCSICDKVFTKSTSLSDHVSYHKIYKCEFCTEKFNQVEYMLQHQRDKHNSLMKK